MKKITILSIAIAVLISYSTSITHAQSTISNLPKSNQLNSKSVNAAALANQPKVTLGKTDLKTVENKKLTNDLSKLTQLQFSPAELERNRVKSWEITPARPFTPGLDLTLHGVIDKKAFSLRPVYSGQAQGQYQLFNMFLMINPVVGKDYKLTLEIEKPEQLPGNSEVIVDLGLQSWRLPYNKNQKTITLLFSNTTPGPHILSISPLISQLQTGKPTPTTLSLTKVTLEELAPAQ
ncbi:MAG: hypothetical protein U5K79_02485 [Cyclobacteriaceae bacterium]|nr:hypothetical protein [Cyclobacteriaceae bacterium]